MTVNDLINALQMQVKNGYGDTPVTVDFPMGDLSQGRSHYEQGDWSTVERVRLSTHKIKHSNETIEAIHLDWRTG